MKKYFSILLSIMLVLGFAASAFAIHADIPSETTAAVAKGASQITLDGELRMRGWMIDNINSTGYPVDIQQNAYYDARVRLGVAAKVSANTQGYVQLESGSAPSADTWAWGSGVNGKPSTSLTVLQAWILHTGSGLLGAPAGMKVGHMPLALGQKQFLDHTKYGDDALVLFVDPIKGLHIGVLNAKFNEGNWATNHDIDGYVALAVYKVDSANTIGINYSLVKATDTPGGPNSGWYGTPSDGGVDFQNLGLHANGLISGITYEAEFDTQFGHALKGSDNQLTFSGYGALLNLGYKIDNVNLRLGLAYGSGDNGNSGNKLKEFQTTMGRDMHYTFIYEYLMRTAANQQALDSSHSGSSATGRATGIANTNYIRLGVDYAATKDLNLSLDGFILRASQTVPVTTNTFVPGVGPVSTTSSVSKELGTEIDFKLAYQIDKNLTYGINAGYFAVGDFYRDVNGSKKDVTALMHSLTLSF